MVENTIHIVMAHGAAKATFDRHMPIWESNGFPINVVCPKDDPITSNHPVIPVGTRQHHGSAAIDRFVKIIQIGIDSKYPFILFDEYDSFCLEIPFTFYTEKGIHGFDWRDQNPNSGFNGTHFLHPPLFMDTETAAKIVKSSIELKSMGNEQGFWDRWIGMICEKGDIPIHSTEKIHYTRNTIEPAHMAELYEAVKHGAKLFHGVKTKVVHDMITGDK